MLTSEIILSSSSPMYYSIIDASGLGPNSKIKYKRELDRMQEAGVNPANHADYARYAATRPYSAQKILKAAVALILKDEQTFLEASATPENLPQVQAALLNMQAIHKTIQVRKPAGKKTPIWLSPAQVEQITSIPDRSTPAGRRDWIVLATLLGAGLRRSEMAGLTFTSLKRQPKKNGQMRGVLEVHGKGDKYRTVPIKPLLEERLKEWHREVGDRFIARAVNKAGTINGSLSDHAVNDIVKKYGALIGLPELEAHDCRRTWAQLGLNAGIPIQQISRLLGHESIKTTQDYLDLHIDIEQTVSDFVPLSGD
jgi:site-specific recombinase XerD